MQTSILSYFQKLQAAIAAEKEEEISQGKKNLENLSIQERRHKGICWYPLIIKDRGYGLGDYPFLEVETPQSTEVAHQFSGGKPVSLFSNLQSGKPERIEGTVHYASSKSMRIIFKTNELPDWVDEGKLGVDLLVDLDGYREMDKVLKEILTQNPSELQAYISLIFEGKIQIPDQQPSSTFEYPSHLNSAQKTAIQHLLALPTLGILHGPPGTGKTSTLVAFAQLYCLQGKKLLACAPSNAAADVLAEKMHEAGLSVIRIGNLSRVDATLLHLTPEGIIQSHTDYKKIKNYRKQSSELKRMAHTYKRKFGREEQQQRQLLFQEAKKIAQLAVDLENYDLDKAFIEADVVVSTLIGSTNDRIKSLKFDCVLIDESGQALEAATWVALKKAPKAVLAGDPFQLPPTVKSIKAAEMGLSVTLLEKLMQKGFPTFLLDEQYRMHQDLMGFSSGYFYKNLLKSNLKNAHQRLPDASLAPLMFIDTAGSGYEESINPVSVSLWNEKEALFLERFFNAHFETCQLKTLAIVSPYREQLQFLKKLNWQLNENTKIDLDTIDSFQGSEADVVLLSLVRSNDRGEIGFLSDVRRMNVALTRAKYHLIVIGDSSTLANHSFYQSFIEYCQQNEWYSSVWDYPEFL